MTKLRILLRRDTAANWTSANPVLGEGEAGIEMAAGPDRIKVGDGLTAWVDLPYLGEGQSVDSVNGETGAVTLSAADVGADPAGSAATVASTLTAHDATTGPGDHVATGGASGDVLTRTGGGAAWQAPAVDQAEADALDGRLDVVEAALPGKADDGDITALDGRLDTAETTLGHVTYRSANVRTHGALGDGTTNDTAAFQAAVTAATTSPIGEVYVPPGTYMVAPSLAIPAGLTLRGTGSGSVVKRVGGAGTNGDVVTVTGSDVTIRDITLHGNVSAGGLTGRAALDVAVDPGLSNLLVDNVRVVDAPGMGIRHICLIENLTIKDCEIVNPATTGIFVQLPTSMAPVGDGKGVRITGCLVDKSGQTTLSSHHGIAVRGSDDASTRWMDRVRIIDNDVRFPIGGGGLAIEVWAHATTIQGNATVGAEFGISKGCGVGASIVGNTVRAPSTIGIEMLADQQDDPANNAASVCVGNTVDGQDVTGVGISCSNVGGVDEAVVSGNVVRDFVDYGAHLIGPARVAVTGNLFTWNGAASGVGVPSRGLWLQNNGQDIASAGRLLVVGNLFDAGRNAATDADATGIRVDQDGDVDPGASITINDNHFAWLGTGVYFAAADSGDIDGTLSGNYFASTVTAPVAQSITGGGTVALTRIGNAGDPTSVPVPNTPVASDHGLVAWTVDPTSSVYVNVANANGTLYCNAVHVRATTAVTKLCFYVGTVAGTPVAGQNWIGLYDATGALLVSAALDSVVTSTGNKVVTVASTPVAPGRYWVGILTNAASGPNLARSGVIAPPLANFNLTAANYRTGTSGTGQTTLPASFTPSALSQSLTLHHFVAVG